MSLWNRREYRCVMCREPYMDYDGGSRYCSIGCAHEGRTYKPETCAEHGHELEWQAKEERWQCPDCRLRELLGGDELISMEEYQARRDEDKKADTWGL